MHLKAAPRDFAALLEGMRACRVCAGALPLEPRPIFQLDGQARILISGQAPGTRAHEAGTPFLDPSGDRLRDWLGIDAETFYDKSRIAILPMGMCYPGLAKSGGDAPPRPECAPLWHDRVLAAMRNVKLHLLVGGYSQRRYLGERAKSSLSETVAAWRDYLPHYLPLPHPSWRNNGWLKRHPWFSADLLPELRKRVTKILAVAAFGFHLGACAPDWQESGPIGHPPASALLAGHFQAQDGAQLPLRVWPAEGVTRAVAIALHGFNDYSNAFAQPAPWWAAQGVSVYAYDQRGFGATAQAGLWPGTELLVRDLADLAGLVRKAHPGAPLYLIGESMGAAVIMAAMTGPAPPAADGVILSAPAVWAGSRYNGFAKAGAWALAHTLPWFRLSGRGLQIQASDNVEMLQALGRDPLFIKETRADAIWGLALLMQEALDVAPDIGAPTLLLYGDKDEVVRPDAFEELEKRLPQPVRLARYPDGWHLLFRDLGREVAFRDALAWMLKPDAPLPSGLEQPRQPVVAAE